MEENSGKFYWIHSSRKGWLVDIQTKARVSINQDTVITPKSKLDEPHFGTPADYTASTQNQGIWIADTVKLTK